MTKPYAIGLDIGTNSVGWAVITDDYKVPAKQMLVMGNTDKAHIKKNLMGVLLFDEGRSAADRRQKRISRRRLARRRHRLTYLQAIFADEINQIDDHFFHRLDESFLWAEDKSGPKHPIFGNLSEELAYHERFPTIYHLRQHLADSKDKADLRLVYLALSHIIKYRGHFLIDGELQSENIDIQKIFENFISLFDEIHGTDYSSQHLDVKEELVSKLSKSHKVERVLEKLAKPDKSLKLFLSLAVGLQVNVKSVCGLQDDLKLQIPEDTYDEDLSALLAMVSDSRYEDLFQELKNLYDAILLSGILMTTNRTTHAKLSASMVERYEEHREDLANLKTFVRQALPTKYQEIFGRKSDKGYTAYINKGLSQEGFYKYLRDLLLGIDGSSTFLKKIDQETFLRKQRTVTNGAIPNQIHLQELRAILKRQGEHYPFLKTNSTKIESILTFRIPYYIGPLHKGQSTYAWLVRKSEASIRPWNFDDLVDTEDSAQAFIDGLTNYDLYLPSEKVLPKHSLLYQTFAVYNELTKVRYVNEQGKCSLFDTHLKQAIVQKVFKSHRKVKKENLLDYLKDEFPGYRIVDVLGLDAEKKAFNASLSTYHDLKKILGSAVLEQLEEKPEILEEVIHILTVFEDKQMIKKRLRQLNLGCSEEVLTSLSRRHYTGWGTLSKKLIHGIKDKQTNKTILDFLIDDGFANRNFMQLIHDKGLTFKETIADAQNRSMTDDISAIVADLSGSPAIKKGILQSIKIVDELVKVMGGLPQEIVIEMARETQTTLRGRLNSQERLKTLEGALAAFGSHLLTEEPTDNVKLSSDRLYLYYLQNGKDMYTGSDLDINRLSDYDIDHIIPQSFIKDNSLDNRVLTSRSSNRGNKMDNVPSEEVIKNMRPFWDKLLAAKLISQRKYSHLTKGNLTDKDKEGFIRRQLVETRQITKHVARLLDERFNTALDQDGKRHRTVKILTLKSQLTADFREAFELYKVRAVNDYHHAHDAYLNAVIGKALLTKYPHLAPEFVYGEYVKTKPYTDTATEKNKLYTNLTRFFQKEEAQVNGDGEIAWDKTKHIALVKKVLSCPQINVVKKAEVQTVGQNGGLFDNNLVSAKKVGADKLIPIKKGLAVEKYGGYSKPTTAYPIVLVADKCSGRSKQAKRVKELYPISIMDKARFETDPIAFLESRGYSNIDSSNLIKLPKYSLIDIGQGIKRLSATSKEIHKGNQLIVSKPSENLLYHASRITKGDSLEYLKSHREQFDALFAELMAFAKRTKLSKERINDLESVYLEKSVSAPIEDLATSFLEVLKFTRMGASSPFVFLGKKLRQTQYTGKEDYLVPFLNGILIHQSVTGLYETRMDLSRLGER